MRYNYVGPDTPWKAQFLSISKWRASYSSLFYIVELEHITHFNIAPDELHIMHSGTSMYMLGSIISMLVFQMLDGSPQTNMEQVWSEFMDYYAEHKLEIQFTNLELGNLHNAGN